MIHLLLTGLVLLAGAWARTTDPPVIVQHYAEGALVSYWCLPGATPPAMPEDNAMIVYVRFGNEYAPYTCQGPIRFGPVYIWPKGEAARAMGGLTWE